ncbi:ribonuclease activity regulator RraA [Maribacter sp. SA7]|uniref:ribonuclease activity regulator RraA n=1 Tax=Maribacter zhoushanensis TaxID=3030012 RepID=UPI0023ED76A4|nr:ribonuclease activity regulator RraA [Maribacter zhoushanensis]MDF4203875.1 ribonuclease activity regulator RraA [Maribacter zhoushanensis]
MTKIAKATKEKLRKVSTATVATCLFKKGLKNQFIQHVKPLKLGRPTMVGEAYTLRYIPAREDLNPISVFRDPKHLQRVAVEECPEGAVMVIDSRQNARAASAGSILVTRLMVRNAEGIVTDGGFRDSAEIADLDFSSYHNRPTAPTNLTLHQAIAINDPIGCGDVAVFPGDVILGDDDGVMVIPAHLADEVADECIQMTMYEEFVIEQVQGGRAVIGLYPMVDEGIKAEFEKWKVDRN